MGSRRQKNDKKGKAAPSIVPRFLKRAVAVGAIPAFAAACEKKPPRMQPVVAAYQREAEPNPPQDAAQTPDIVPPVVAAYQTPPPAVVAAYQTPVVPPVLVDAGVDAAPPKNTKKQKKAPATGIVAPGPGPFTPPIAVVAAYQGPKPPPPVVAAYQLRDAGAGQVGPTKPAKKP